MDRQWRYKSFTRSHPPEDELGVPVALTRVLVHEPGVRIALEGATVYSAGIQLDVRWKLERLESTPEEVWADIRDSVMGHRIRGSRRAGESLSWTVTLDSGERIPGESFMDRVRADHQDTAQDLEAPSLTELGGGGGGSDTHWKSSTKLWLRPIPAADFELGWVWPACNVPAGQVSIPAAPLLAASDGVLPF